MMSDDTRRKGRDAIAHAWWEALDELRAIAAMGEHTPDRIAAARTILEYCSQLNVGLGDPYLPDEPEPEEVEDDDD